MSPFLTGYLSHLPRNAETVRRTTKFVQRGYSWSLTTIRRALEGDHAWKYGSGLESGLGREFLLIDMVRARGIRGKSSGPQKDIKRHAEVACPEPERGQVSTNFGRSTSYANSTPYVLLGRKKRDESSS